MKIFFSFSKQRRNRSAGFSLVEVAVSLGLFSLGFISLVPIMAIGLTSNRQSRDEQVISQIAQTMIEEDRQGTLQAGPAGYDDTGAACTGSQSAAYTTSAIYSPMLAGGVAIDSLHRLTLRVTPRGQPNRVRVYAVVLPGPMPAASP